MRIGNPFRVICFFVGSVSAFASLIPINTVPNSGNGLGAVNSLVTFQNTGDAVGCVGVSSAGTLALGANQCYGGVNAVGGVTHEQTGSGNNIYSASSLSLAPTGANTFGNVILIFNGNEGGGAGSGIVLNALSLNLFTPTGSLLGAFSLEQEFVATAFPGVGNAGFGFQLDAAQSGIANGILAANPNLLIGASASVSGANAGPETISISRINTVQNGGGGDVPGGQIPEPSTYALIGGGLTALAFLRRRQ